ncbi:hypothetical protein [Chamaesiphon sp.]|uniref:hypothetical protein n=1 Tax=Chamaesiphon sp. TaxID=2814140 RepID=UPI003592E885
MNQFHQNFIIRVVDLYGLELDGDRIDTLVEAWLQKYDPSWIVKAIVESLYRGRYKIKSVDNILKDWHRLGKPRHNFTPEYEREILQNLPDPIDIPVAIVLIPSSSPDVGLSPVEQPQWQSSVPEASDTQLATHQPPLVSCENLDPEESAPFGRHHHSSNCQLDRPQVEIAVVETANSESPSIEDSEEDRDRSLFRSLPQLSSGILKGKPANGNGKGGDRSHRIVTQPVKHHLFSTLKAIVDPNHQQGVAACHSVCLPLYVMKPNSPQIRQFQPPLEHPSEEQCL